ncbi:MAG: hypothetical protein JEZ00_16020 [Anaerolineaceae bacterium]|nr:hypothetical protein [Anaerolineaceae bacterium]
MKQKWHEKLPLQHSASLLFWMTILIGLLSTATAVFSLFNPALSYPTQDIKLAFFPSDIAMLIVGFPLLLICIILLLRSNFAGLLCWPGALFFIMYSYALYLFGIPFGPLFLVYLLIVSLSIFTLIGVVTSIEPQSVKSHFHENVPIKFAAGVLIGLAVMILMREIGLIVSALSTGREVSQVEMSLWITDFVFGSPPLIIVGVLLWTRRAFGFVAAPGLLLQYGMLSIGLIPVLIYQAIAGGIDFDIAGLIVVIVMILLCMIPFVLLIKAQK